MVHREIYFCFPRLEKTLKWHEFSRPAPSFDDAPKEHMNRALAPNASSKYL